MSDRLPQPLAEHLTPTAAERASATPAPLPLRAAPRGSAQPRGAPIQHDLPALQAWMLEAICADAPPATRGVVVDGPRLSADDRLGIYRYAYTARLRECLQDDYPVLAQSLGEARFEVLCRQYVQRYPSSSYSLNGFGRHMPQLCRDSDLPAGDFYAELATLELSLLEVIHAPAPAALDTSVLQQIAPDAWGRARFTPSESLRLLRFEYPVNAHFQACRANGVVLPPPAASPCATAVYRRGVELWRMDLTQAMTRVLGALVRGEQLGHALQQIGVDERDPQAIAEAERSVMVWFQTWVASSFFSAVAIDPE